MKKINLFSYGSLADNPEEVATVIETIVENQNDIIDWIEKHSLISPDPVKRFTCPKCLRIVLYGAHSCNPTRDGEL